MPEQINYDYEVSGNGPEKHWAVPYSRLEDATPTVANPCAVKSRINGRQLTGVILSLDAALSMAVIDASPGNVYKFLVRNILTYSAGSPATFGTIQPGDPIFYDRSTDLAAGVYLTLAPTDENTLANPLFGYAVPIDTEGAFTKASAADTTVAVGIMIVGAGAN